MNFDTPICTRPRCGIILPAANAFGLLILTIKVRSIWSFLIIGNKIMWTFQYWRQNNLSDFHHTFSKLWTLPDYLMENYIELSVSFPPSVCAAIDNSGWKTTNVCESFHSKFNAGCTIPYPKINTLLHCWFPQITVIDYVKCLSFLQPDLLFK